MVGASVRMALFWQCPPTLSALHPQRHSLFPQPSVSGTLISWPNSPRSSSSIHSYPSPCNFRSSLNPNPSIEPDVLSPSARVFIKGLSLSTSEGRLMKVFSQFGEVSKVQLYTDRQSKQSLGFAYVWFTTEDSAELAVKEMNGKFFDGRFVFVRIARFGPSRHRGKATPYKF